VAAPAQADVALPLLAVAAALPREPALAGVQQPRGVAAEPLDGPVPAGAQLAVAPVAQPDELVPADVGPAAAGAALPVVPPAGVRLRVDVLLRAVVQLP